MNIFVSIFKGLLLGILIYNIGDFLDKTICKNSYNIIIEKYKDIYITGKKYVKQNLLVVSPILYGIIDITMLKHSFSFSIYKFLGLILIENIGYYYSHLAMHNNIILYRIHQFHHKFDEITIPSIAHAVTIYEFLFAYLLPIIIGAYILNPTEIEFLSAVTTISIFNLFIHTYELKDIKWIPGLVAPSHHIKHHKFRNKHYAAPIINIDQFVN